MVSNAPYLFGIRNRLFEEAMSSVSDRDERVAKVNEIIEINLELIGSTAIEDKLQDGVSKMNFQ